MRGPERKQLLEICTVMDQSFGALWCMYLVSAIHCRYGQREQTCWLQLHPSFIYLFIFFLAPACRSSEEQGLVSSVMNMMRLLVWVNMIFPASHGESSVIGKGARPLAPRYISMCSPRTCGMEQGTEVWSHTSSRVAVALVHFGCSRTAYTSLTYTWGNPQFT